MQVNSTGLGKTTLVSHISELAPSEDGGLMMKIESTKPVHWYITCQMEPSDVRSAMKMVLKPSVILRVLKMALGIGGAPAVVEAEVVTAAAGKAR